MSLPELTLIPAGAGSGKTYSIQECLGEWVGAGIVAPERIVAVTFTEAAAAELRERIRARLLTDGRLEDAIKLDQAYISTIHGFGLRLLTEFAFEAGMSPAPRLLNEDEQDALVRLALARTEAADRIISDLHRFGYGYDFNSGKGPEDQFRARILDVVARLRNVGWTRTEISYAAQAVHWIRERYGQTFEETTLAPALRDAIARLLEAFPESLVSYATNATARRALEEDYRNLRRARDTDGLERDWALWQALRNLRGSKRGCPLPEPYDELAAVVMAAADALPHHQGPLMQAVAHIEALLGAGQSVLTHYAEAKREAGLVDYTDMVALAYRLLREDPRVAEILARRADCVVIDEFQDTNPIQFALLWRLRAAGVPALVVGDLKQAIMGFQGADPRLLETLERQNRHAREPLSHNWRSQPSLMAFINAMGSGLFGDDYVRLEPKAPSSVLESLEVVAFAERPPRKQHRVRAAHVGLRIRTLLEGGAQTVIDRRTRQLRPLRGGDIAVLCPTNNLLAIYAEVLRRLGLRVRLPESGWFDSRVVQIAWHAFTYLANPEDRHAALYLAVTELGSLELKDALAQLIEEGRIEEPLLERLDALGAGVSDSAVDGVIADTIAALKLFDVIASWPDAEQARANLLRLNGEAKEFMSANREALASGGFHGSGLPTFMAWLKAKVERDDTQPDPRVLDEDAIELSTWHRAKGREWPVVVVAGIDRPVKAWLPDLGLGYADFDDLENLLDGARIEYSPKFAAPESNERFSVSLQAAAETEARRLLYVAITRAREKLVLEWPGYLADKDRVTYWSILSGGAGVTLRDGALRAGGEAFPCMVTQGGTELLPELEAAAEQATPELPVVGRRAVKARAAPAVLTPDSVAATELSAGAMTPAAVSVTTERYGSALELETDLSATALGTVLHRCFEVLGAKPERADRLQAILGGELNGDQVRRIAIQVARFERWIQAHFEPSSVGREVPLLTVNENGTVVSGAADLIVETDDGLWVIDHKSDRVDDPVNHFRHYWPQLNAYARCLQGPRASVTGVGINWICRGEMTLRLLGGHG